MATKLYDLAVKTGSYVKDGEEKGRYENIGSVWKGDNGSYLVIKRTFNPAGVPFKDGSDSIFVSMFEPRQDEQKPQSRQSSRAPANTNDDYEDDIPF